MTDAKAIKRAQRFANIENQPLWVFDEGYGWTYGIPQGAVTILTVVHPERKKVK